MRIRASLTAAALVAAFLCPDPSVSAGPAPTPQPGPWGVRADQTIARAIAADDGTGTAFHYASLAYAIAVRSGQGWQDPRATAYLGKVMELRNPDGGWGLGRPYDAFNDGSVNPSSTTYTVSLTVHVGLVLVDAYRAGAVTAATVNTVTQRLYQIPRITVTGGYCLAYSQTSADTQPGYCVHNVSAGAALYLRAVEDAGLPTSQLWQTRIMLYEARTYDVNQRNWRYFDTSPNWNDPAHNALNFEAMLAVGSAVGRDGLLWYMTRNDADPNDVWLHIGLAPFACHLAGQWLPEFDTKFAKASNSTFALLTQAARATARTADACDPEEG